MNKSKTITSSVTVKTSQVKTSKPTPPVAWKDRISPEEYQHLRDVFIVFDEDGSGTIDPQEISKVLEELGLDRRNSYVLNILTALREKNKILSFDEFVDVVCSKTGQNKTKDGIKRIFDLYDKEQNGQIGFDQLKDIARFIGEGLNDDDINELMHSVFIKNKTRSNESFNFEQFYQIISQYYAKK